MKLKPIFRWYDLWIGAFIDRPMRRVYIFPVPCFGVQIDFDDGPDDDLPSDIKKLLKDCPPTERLKKYLDELPDDFDNDIEFVREYSVLLQEECDARGKTIQLLCEWLEEAKVDPISPEDLDGLVQACDSLTAAFVGLNKGAERHNARIEARLGEVDV